MIFTRKRLPTASGISYDAPVTTTSPKTLRERAETEPEQPRLWHVVLLDSDDHSYEYVIRMIVTLFRRTPADAYSIARTVDGDGRAICLTTHKEHAELKREQIHAFGADPLIARCRGAMRASIEPAESVVDD